MKFQEYCRTTSGNVGVMVALAALVLLGGAGAAVDYSHKLTWQTSLQAAVDGAALAAAGASENDREKTASLYFDANFKHDENVSLLKLKTSEDVDAVIVTADISVQTSVMSALGFKTMKATAKGAASISDRSLEVALVLDVSGSMNASLGGNSRISVLKQAAQDLVDTITDGGKNMSKVEVGIVPFNMNVNVGKTNTSFVKDTSDPLFTGQPWEGCVLERAGTGATSDSFDNSSGVNGKWQAYIWPPEPDSASNCIVPSNGGNTGYASLDAANGYQVMLQGPNFNCVRHEILPLSSSYSDISSKISSLTAEYNMGTIIAPGVSWGMRVLSPGEPFTQGKPASSKLLKFMVVLTDGEQTTEAEYNSGKCVGSSNTGTAYSYDPATYGLAGKTLSDAPQDMFSAYGYIKDSDPFGTSPASWADVRKDLYNISTSACSKAKGSTSSDATRIFTIALSKDAGPGSTTYDLLQNCATAPGDFYLATDANQLKDAFKAIANEIKDIRLTQ